MMKTTLLVLSLCCITSVTFAAKERNYDVQVLIFSHITPDTLQLQQWPAVSPEQNTQIIKAPAPATDLQSEKNALLKNPNYQILLDASWPETWSSDQSTITIPIASMDGKLNGWMEITLGHYFDVHANLLLTVPTATLQQLSTNGYFSKWSQPNFTFQLLQKRRMRSNELNYLEHPLMGMLIKITPVRNEQPTK